MRTEIEGIHSMGHIKVPDRGKTAGLARGCPSPKSLHLPENPSSTSGKHKSFAAPPKSPVSSARSVPLRGRIAIVTDVGMECDGRGLPQAGFWPRRRTADCG